MNLYIFDCVVARHELLEEVLDPLVCQIIGWYVKSLQIFDLQKDRDEYHKRVVTEVVVRQNDRL